MQVLIRALGSRTIVLDVGPPPSTYTVGDVKRHILAIEGISTEANLKLEFCGKCLADDKVLIADVGLVHGSTLNLFLPLLGGKGGFGSNLRAAGKLKLVDNFDACRDLQGRRIRHKTAAEKLANWTLEAQERELEKVAMKYIKDVSRGAERKQKDDVVEVDVERVRKEVEENVNGVAQAVQAAFAVKPAAVPANRNKGKRKRGALDSLLLGEDDSEGENGSEDEVEEEERQEPEAERQADDLTVNGADRKVDVENSRRGET